MKYFLRIVILVQFLLIAFLVLVLTGVLGQLPFVSYFASDDSLNSMLFQLASNNKPTNPDDTFSERNVELGTELQDNRSPEMGALEQNPKMTTFRENSPLTVNLDLLRKSSPLTPGEVYNLDISDDDLWGYFPKSEKRLKQIQELDPQLSLVNFRGKNFNKSQLAKYLKLHAKTKIYVFLEFTQGLNSEIFYSLRMNGFAILPILSQKQYFRKHAGIFYVPFNKLRRIINSSSVKNIYILSKYTASVKYQLGIKSSESTDFLEFKINYPYSKPGLKISDLYYYFKGPGPFTQDDAPEKNLLTVQTPIVQEELYLFTSEYNLEVDLLENLKRNFLISAKELSLNQYHEEIVSVPEIKDIFTRPGEKIVTSEYVSNILRQINTDMDITGIWKQITFILDKDIEYDWQKRELFFSGNLPYYNIKDMYLNVEELSEKKVGACTERTSLEIAILRELGIAARSATRVYHIFTEIYVPKKGWLSTSLILNEIPLCHSYNENMAYFIQWNKEFPIRLKWVGNILPKILQNIVDDSGLVRR